MNFVHSHVGGDVKRETGHEHGQGVPDQEQSSHARSHNTLLRRGEGTARIERSRVVVLAVVDAVAVISIVIWAGRRP